MNSSVCRHFFLAMIFAAVLALLVDDGALAILYAVAALIALPLAFGGEADAVARATRRRLRDASADTSAGPPTGSPD